LLSLRCNRERRESIVNININAGRKIRVALV
jgi:hypothetical protein